MLAIICIHIQKRWHVMIHFTQRLRDLREDNDLSQEDVAKILNITRQQYQLYESGKRELKIYQLIALCKYYNVCSDYILGFKDEPLPIKWLMINIGDVLPNCAKWSYANA